MIIPLAILLIPYGLVLMLFFVLAIVHAWHVVKLSSFDSAAFFMFGFFVVTTIIILSVTVRYAVGVSWGDPLFVIPI
ncbi:MAG: hypothetical protein Q7S89_02740 [bacterium]|nr:hypothetical protein [bacterium]